MGKTFRNLNTEWNKPAPKPKPIYDNLDICPESGELVKYCDCPECYIDNKGKVNRV